MFSWFSGGGSSARAPSSKRLKVEARQINDSLYELWKPSGKPTVEVLFFHGLQFGELPDAHLRTWESGDGCSLWPQKWLVEEFPTARILCVSYNGGVEKSSGESFDMHIIVENLLSDFIQEGIGQRPNCPVVLVGYCFGGLVLKKLCLQANNQKLLTSESERAKVEAFLENMEGVFYYGTPHRGIPDIDKVTKAFKGPLLSYFETLSKEASRLDFEFDQLCRAYANWQIHGLGESLPTKLGLFDGIVAAPETSSRKGHHFNVVRADHLSICKPQNQTDMRFYALTSLLRNITRSIKVVIPGHQTHGLPEKPVELEARALEVSGKLSGGGILGIFGMGGIGKTTLAKQVFNTISNEFDYTCFVDNVKGIQFHTLEDWLLNHFHRGGQKCDRDRTQWVHLMEKKVLIVMDDINSEDQLRVLPRMAHFGKGSCLIMTSRDKEVFKFYGDCIIYEVDFLKEDDAKQLFCQHAFGQKDMIPDLLKDNVNAMVKKCGGLPLTLEVMGRYLRGHGTNAKVWVETIDRLQNVQAISGAKRDRVWASLRVSYDDLSEQEQEMFIEAALVFFEGPLDEALAAWSPAGGNEETTWANLVSRSLVKEMDKKVWVHEHLRDLAENISQGIMLSDSNNANLTVDRLNANKVKPETKSLLLKYAIEGNDRMFHSKDNGRATLQLDSLAGLQQLKYIKFKGALCEGQGKGLTRKLSLLKWEGNMAYRTPDRTRPKFIPYRPPPQELQKLQKFEISINNMDYLAVLELKSFVIPAEFPASLGNLPNLRFLSLGNLEGLDHLPENFGNLSRLRGLELEDLCSLTLPKSFGNLLALERLTFSRIKSLHLPESLGDCSSLLHLEISRCEDLAGLPDSFGRCLPLLKKVFITRCPRMTCLSHCFSRLRSLQKLVIWFCPRFSDLGDAFCKLSSLRELNLVDVGLQKLPPNFGLLSGLEVLLIQGARNLSRLPDELGQLTALKELLISAKELTTLPKSFCCLKSLRALTIHCPQLESLPENLGEHTQLEKLNLAVERVDSLPLSVGNLYSLRYLAFTSSIAKVLPDSLGQLSSLKSLKLECPNLQNLPDNIGNLRVLEELSISSSSLEKLPDLLGQLSLLEKLSMSLPILERLPESIGQLHNLRALTLQRANKLTSLPDIFGQLVALQVLDIKADQLQTLPDSFSFLKSLQRLSIHSSKLESLPKCLGEQDQLTDLCLDINSVQAVPGSVGTWCSLKELTVSAKVLKVLHGNLGQLSSLESLTLDCDNVETLPDSVGKLSSLQKLSMSVPLLETLPESIGQLHNLTELTLRRANKLTSLPDKIGQLVALQVLDIKADQLQTLPDSFSFLKSLQRLSIHSSKLESLPKCLGEQDQLTDLCLDINSVQAVPGSVGTLCSLKELALSAKALKVLPGNLGQLSSLESLTLDCDNVETLPDSVGKLSSLQKLSMSVPLLESLPESIGQLHNLTELTLQRANKLTSLPDIFGQLVALRVLDIKADQLQTLPDSFSFLKSLQRLSIHSSKLESLPKCLGEQDQLTDLCLDINSVQAVPGSVGTLCSLKELTLSAKALKVLPGNLGQLSSLESLKLNCDNVETLPDSVGKLSSLKRLSMSVPLLKSLPESIG
ncbi:unnamed protein product [Calypogeia fissa]